VIRSRKSDLFTDKCISGLSGAVSIFRESPIPMTDALHLRRRPSALELRLRRDATGRSGSLVSNSRYERDRFRSSTQNAT
jgi:hypothetical protein